VSDDVVIVATGGANLASLQFALQRAGAEPIVTESPDTILAAGHVLLPGVGAAQDTMSRLEANGLAEVVPQINAPVLGICLGMQLLFSSSAEDDADCLGIIDGRANRFEVAPSRPVPQMGWNAIAPVGANPLFEGIAAGSYCYFVHSYALPVATSTIATAEYGIRFAAAAQQKNFFGTQFHPERSGAVGARVLNNFLALN
jgi:glutamine amidotransferase